MTMLIYDYGSPENNAKVLAAMAELPPDIDDHISDNDFRPEHRPSAHNLSVEQARARYCEGYAASKPFRVEMTVGDPVADGQDGDLGLFIKTYGSNTNEVPPAFQKMQAGAREPGRTEFFGDEFKYYAVAFVDARSNQDQDFWAEVNLRWLLNHLSKFDFSLIERGDDFLEWCKKFDEALDHAYRRGSRVYDRVDPEPGDPANSYG